MGTKSKKNRTTVEELATAFISWVEDNRSENTLRMYSNRLKPFRKQFGNRRIKSLTPIEMDSYLKSVNKWPDGTEKAPDTIRANITAVEQMERYAIEKEVIRRKFFGKHEKPVGRIRDRLPTPEEVEKIKAVAPRVFVLAWQALRQSGARPNELGRFAVDNWDRPASLIVLGKHKTAKKTGRPRKITVGEKLQALIVESLGTRTEGPLFLTPRGHQWTTDTLSQSFRRYRIKAGVEKGVVIYSSRHEHATAVCKALGMDAAADALGHTGTGMTRRYVHKDPQELRSNQDSVSL
jgi:integrase